MKKFGLLPLIAAFMLFGSGLALAKIYWLPDYLGDNMSRSTDDDTNRTKSCSDNGMYASPLGNGYTCSQVVYAHQVCYDCKPKPCPSGYTAGLTKCAEKTGYSASYSSNGLSGTQTCGKCDYKELPCASGYSTSYQSVSDCHTSKDKGWTFSSKGQSGTKLCGRCDPKPASNCSGKVMSVSGCGARGASGWKLCSSSPSCYAGDTPYYDCCALSCNSPYAAGVTSCSPSNGHTWKQDKDRYNGDTVCGYCETKSCPNNEMTQTTCYAKTNGSNGWIWKGTSNYTGATQCGTCTAKTCDNSYQTAASTCGTTGASGWTINTGNKCYAGATTKYKCTAKTCASGVLKSACGSGYTWTFNRYYSGDNQCGNCVLAQCPKGYSIDKPNLASCGSVSSGWTWDQKGTMEGKVCGRCLAKSCPSGSMTMSSIQSSSNYNRILVGSANGSYNGDSACYAYATVPLVTSDRIPSMGQFGRGVCGNPVSYGNSVYNYPPVSTAFFNKNIVDYVFYTNSFYLTNRTITLGSTSYTVYQINFYDGWQSICGGFNWDMYNDGSGQCPTGNRGGILSSCISSCLSTQNSSSTDMQKMDRASCCTVCNQGFYAAGWNNPYEYNANSIKMPTDYYNQLYGSQRGYYFCPPEAVACCGTSKASTTSYRLDMGGTVNKFQCPGSSSINMPHCQIRNCNVSVSY